jgi:hypothetical protein
MIELILVFFIAFLPAIHPNNLLLLFKENLPLLVGFLIGLLPISTKLYQSENINHIKYILSVLIGAGIAVLFGLMNIYYLYKPFKFYIWILTILIFIFIIVKFDLKFLLSFIIFGIWGIIALDEKYLYHIFVGIFSIPFLLFKKEASSQDNFNYKASILGGIIGSISLFFPAISSASFFASILPIYANYYTGIIGAQYIGSVIYYFETGLIRNGYVEAFKNWYDLFYMIIGMVLGSIISSKIEIPRINLDKIKYISLIAVLILGLYQSIEGFIIMIASACLVYLFKDYSSISYLGVIIIPTIFLLLNLILK